MAQYWHGASERWRAMESANKFNKAEADKRAGTSGGSTISSGPSECIICQGTQAGKAADLSEGDKGPILPLGSDHAAGLQEGERKRRRTTMRGEESRGH